MKWTKSKNLNIWIHHGKKYTYAYFEENGECKLLVETINIPPTKTISYVMPVFDIKTAKQIAELLER